MGDGVGPIQGDNRPRRRRRVTLEFVPDGLLHEGARDAHALREVRAGPRVARIRHCQEVLFDVIHDQDGVCAGKLSVPRLFDKKARASVDKKDLRVPDAHGGVDEEVGGEHVAPERVRAGVVKYLPDELCAVVGDAKVTDGGVVASSKRGRTQHL